MRNTESGSFLYLYDANGNVGQLVNAADGSIAAHYEYDPFGKLLAASSPEADQNSFRFSTKYFDAETGLYYYGYRYYSPDLGRWITRDPLGELGGLNIYNAFRNNGINIIDPIGLRVVQLSSITIHQYYRSLENMVLAALGGAGINVGTLVDRD